MDNKSAQIIPLLDVIKIQMDVIMPLLKAVRAELGKERADRLVFEALQASSREELQTLESQITGSPKEKFYAICAMGEPQIQAEDIDRETLREDADVLEFNITGCRYAEFFHQLGEPELGAVLLCDFDYHVVEIGSPEVEFTRTQTIMKGERCCDFRYRFTNSSTPK
jgi:hypothetical protein